MAVERSLDIFNLQPGQGAELAQADLAPDLDIQIMDDMELDADGGATIDLAPLPPLAADGGFYSNLVDVLDPGELSEVRSYVLDSAAADEESRKDWKDTYIKGLELLGLKNETRTEPFEGATGVFHPLLTEAIGQFAAGAYKELIPANGPANAKVLGKSSPDMDKRAQRIKDYMNYKLMFEMEEYEPEFDQMLYYVALAGSVFKKVYRDEDLGRTVSPFVQAENLLVPYTASSLRSAERVTQVIPMSRNKLRRLQMAGFYAESNLPTTSIAMPSDIKQKYDELEGRSPSGMEEGDYTLYECHCNFSFASLGDNDIRVPYIVTVVKETQDVIGIRRNWREGDMRKRRKEYFVHYKFTPGLGFFGFGLIHLLGNMSQSATSTLRQLIDSGTLANLPGGFKTRGLRIANDQQAINPGEWRDVDVPGQSIREALLPLPYKEPSATLFQLLGFVVGAAEKFIGTQELGIADGNKETPVGTTVALLERGTKIMSAVHKRLHGALKVELKLLAENFAQEVQAYPYEVDGGMPEIFAEDFGPQIDVVPISDPNIFSMAQRVVLAQEQLKLAQTAPELHDTYEAYRRMYSALGIDNIDDILKPPQPPLPENAAIENGRMPMIASGAPAPPVQAFPDQNHDAHIAAHMAFAKSKIVKTSMPIYAVLLQHVYQHMALKAEAAARQELGMEPMQPPTLEQPVDPTSMEPQLQNRTAELIAQYMVAFSDKEAQFIGDEAGSDDPIIALKSREISVREKDNERDADLERLKIDQKERLEKLKMQQKEELERAKLAQQARLEATRTREQRVQNAVRTTLDITKMQVKPNNRN
jgi:hypothetical protein